MKIITVMSFIGIIGAMGGLEQGMFGVIGWLIRTAVFMVLLVSSYIAGEIIEERKRAKRVAARKAQKIKHI